MGRRLRDPGNVWPPAGAEGEGQGWEKPWAGGRGVPGEGGGGRGTGCQGPEDGSLPRRGLPVGALARSLPTPSPANPSAILSQSSPPQSGSYHTSPAPNSRRRLRSPPAGTPPHCSAAAAPPPPPTRRGPSPSPHLPGSLQSRTEELGSYPTLARSLGRHRTKTPGSLQVRGVNFGLSGCGNQNPESLGEWGAAVRLSRSSKWEGCWEPRLLSLRWGCWRPKFPSLLGSAVRGPDSRVPLPLKAGIKTPPGGSAGGSQISGSSRSSGPISPKQTGWSARSPYPKFL